MTSLPFPPVIDNSMRSDFVACPRKFYHRYIQGYRRAGQSVHLHFGAAFAEGMAAYRTALFDGFDVEKALAAGTTAIIRAWGDFEPPPDATKTLERCVGALEAQCANWPPLTDHLRPARSPSGDSPMVEFSFALPLTIAHPASGEPLIYSGRFDMIGEMGNGLWVVDDKTTGQLGASWMNNWKLRAQFTGYAWGAREFGWAVQGAIVRGISILKKGYGFAEVIEHRPEWMIANWHTQLLRDVRRMIDAWRADEWDQSLSDACSSFGGCPYLDLCTTPNPERWMDLYEYDPFDPLRPHTAIAEG